jgi:hypothetical protein
MHFISANLPHENVSLSTEKLCFKTTDLASIFASFCVASTDEGRRDWLEVCSITVVIAPHRQLGLALYCALLATCNRDRDDLGHHNNTEHTKETISFVQQPSTLHIKIYTGLIFSQ